MAMITGSSSANPRTRYVLRILGEGSTPSRIQHVNHGYFFPDVVDVVDLGKCYWRGIVKRRVLSETGYLISDGFGGAHAVLWGFSGAMTGNMYNGTTSISFSGYYSPAINEWIFAELLYDEEFIRVFVNGICDGKVAFTGPRVSPGIAGGAGVLNVGGSDHNNLTCDIAYLQGWDRDQAVFSAGTSEHARRPHRFPPRYSTVAGSNPCDFFADYTIPGATIWDSSPRGCSHNATATDRFFHHGRLSGGRLLDDMHETLPGTFTRPNWIVDNTCPYGEILDGNHHLPDENIPSPGSVPPGCLVFDSFGRRNQTYAFQATPSLGSTEGGSLGALAWQSGMTGGYTLAGVRNAVFGILGGAAVFVHEGPGSAWVEVGTAEQDVRISRAAASAVTGKTGLCFRMIDKDNGWSAYADGGTLYLLSCTAGTNTLHLSEASPNQTWTTLRVKALGTTIQMFVDDGAGWLQVGTNVTSSVHQAGTKAGLAGFWVSTLASSLARYKNFTVFTAS